MPLPFNHNPTSSTSRSACCGSVSCIGFRVRSFCRTLRPASARPWDAYPIWTEVIQNKLLKEVARQKSDCQSAFWRKTRPLGHNKEAGTSLQSGVDNLRQQRCSSPPRNGFSVARVVWQTFLTHFQQAGGSMIARRCFLFLIVFGSCLGIPSVAFCQLAPADPSNLSINSRFTWEHGAALEGHLPGRSSASQLPAWNRRTPVHLES